MQESPYVEYRDNVYRVAGTRVALDSIIRRFWKAMPLKSLCNLFQRERWSKSMALLPITFVIRRV